VLDVVQKTVSKTELSDRLKEVVLSK